MSEDYPENSNSSPSSGGTVEYEESFEKLLEESDSIRRKTRLRPGEKVKATVISISDDSVYIDFGEKSEGVVALSEFVEDGVTHLKEGDEVNAFFLSKTDGTMRFTTLIHGYSPVKLEAIRDAQAAGIPVNGEVKREVKGGFEVSVGGIRCFCPFSHIDLSGGREGGVFLGLTFPFKVLEFEEDGRNIIVSRRALLEEEKKAKIEELKKSLEVGAEITGIVRSVQKFGVFVALEGVVDALIPVSEMGWGRIEEPKNLLSVNQEVTAKLIALDWEKNRLTLSLKAMQPNPWTFTSEKYPVGVKVSGTIVRLEPFGAFVNLEPAIDGLIHISNLGAGRRINHPKEVVEVGQSVEAYVLAVDPEKGKISLSLEQKLKPEEIELPEKGELIDGVVDRVMPYGIFLKMSSGLTGLIPNAEMGTSRGTDHSHMFPAGTDMQAVVIEVDKKHHRVRLSRKAVIKKTEQDEYSRYKNAANVQEQKSSSGMGSFGELLKAKMDEREAV